MMIVTKRSVIISESGKAYEQAARLIAAGGIVAFRTDTFYGLGADPFNRDAVRMIGRLKEREGQKPILVLISDEAEVDRFAASRSFLFDAVSQRHWPGALTIVVAARPTVPDELTAGTGTVGLRLPDNESVRNFVRACGGALTATSANLAGEPPARTAQDVARYFPTEITLIVDGGAVQGDQPSTVIDLSGPGARLIREGLVSHKELEATLKVAGSRFIV